MTGCGTASPETKVPERVTPIVLGFCATYVPVYSAAADTEETKRQIDKNNAVWLEFCDDKWQSEVPEAPLATPERG